MEGQGLALENARLRHVLAAENRILKAVRDALLEQPASHDEVRALLDRLEDHLGRPFEPSVEIDEAERLLHPDRY
jgi:hypothetical protein